MAEPFLSEIRMFSFDFPPRGWAFCNGQLLPVNQNQALFRLLGTTYGGNGTTSFALPNLQARTPIHRGERHVLGSSAGASSHTLTRDEMPSHGHYSMASSLDADRPAAADAVLASANNVYGPSGNLTALPPASVATAGDTQPHPNMQPYVVVSFCIALQGAFPSKDPTPS